jgi:fluoroquinolone transport system permease protein
LWLTLLLPAPPHVRRIIEPYVLVGDITIIGFFFIGGSVFFERQDRTLSAIICSPLRFWEYLSAKITVLLCISMLVALLVVGVAHGAHFHPLTLIAGVLSGTVVMLLAGFASSLPFDSITDWFLSATVPLAVLALPVLYLSGMWASPVLYLIPTQGPLLLFAATFDQLTLSPWQVAYALVYPLVWIAGLYRVAELLFIRFVIERSKV